MFERQTPLDCPVCGTGSMELAMDKRLGTLRCIDCFLTAIDFEFENGIFEFVDVYGLKEEGSFEYPNDRAELTETLVGYIDQLLEPDFHSDDYSYEQHGLPHRIPISAEELMEE